MTDSFVRHLISFVGFLVVFLGWLAGYVSGGHGWWWTGIVTVAVYAIVYSLVEA